jgi:hypothetical protein
MTDLLAARSSMAMFLAFYILVAVVGIGMPVPDRGGRQHTCLKEPQAACFRRVPATALLPCNYGIEVAKA